MNRMRGGRVRVAATGPRGEHFDLAKLFEDLNGKYFDGELQRPPHRVEFQKLAAAIRVLRSGAESNFTESPDGSRKRPAMRRGICFVSRNAACQASTRRSGCSLVSHSKEFRAEEKRFAEFERARRALDRLAR